MKRLLTLLLLPLCLNAQDATVRTWTNQQGRSIKASLVEVQGVNVVIQLENGAKSTVHLGTLSKVDQDYVAKYSPQTKSGAASPASGTLGWPETIPQLDPKSLTVTLGTQDPKQRRFHYFVENFEFISTAQLANSVMSEVSADFLITFKFFEAQCWGWTPKPKNGERFIIYMAETVEDFIQWGGSDRNSADIVGDNIPLIKFSTLGLKKVGARYQYDSRAKDPGRVTSIVALAMLDDVSGWLSPWTWQGMSNFLKFVSYQPNGSVKFKDLDSSMKKAVKELSEANKVSLDMSRVIKYMRTPHKELRGDVMKFKLEQQVDSFVVLYYFGFLDGDGSGSVLHQYYKNVFARSKRARDPDAAQAMLEASGLIKATPEEMLEKIYAGRTDERLAAEMKMKFDKIGLHFD